MSGCVTSDRNTDIGRNRELLVIKPAYELSGRASRLDDILLPQLRELESGVCRSGPADNTCPETPVNTASGSARVEIVEHISELNPDSLAGRRILFAVSLSEAGVNLEYYRLLEHLRAHPGCLQGSVGGIIVDGAGEFYTKAIARRFAFSANMAGCTFPGKSLVEATGSLGNFHVLSSITGLKPEEVYRSQVKGLLDKILTFEFPGQSSSPLPKVLAVHASKPETSNTMLLWNKVRARLEERMDIREVSLRDGEIFDCRGCNYETCLHFGEHASCFYGGIITERVFPAILEADVLILICPNYNDAVSAYLTAFINRLTALFRSNDFSDKRIYALIVSGYSGGDIIAEQLIGALCFNKAFILPSEFAMLETANDPGSILSVPDIDIKAQAFADHIL